MREFPTSKPIAWLCAAWLAMAAGACIKGNPGPDGDDWKPTVIATYPHDAQAFTQGLAVDGGILYEGTGRYGNSSIRRVELDTGAVERMVALPDRYFGEGITILGDRLYQLTWQSGIGFVYDIDTFQRIDAFGYGGEGWGLTHDDEQLIMSDGTNLLRYLDPTTYSVVRTLAVTDRGIPVTRLNELEYIHGEIWSNIWYEDRIARISPATGEVIDWIDLAALYPRAMRLGDDVLNGIAYDHDNRRLFVTGKNWPYLFELAAPVRQLSTQ